MDSLPHLEVSNMSILDNLLVATEQSSPVVGEPAVIFIGVAVLAVSLIAIILILKKRGGGGKL
ncbi:MAG: hypothetical protein FWB93_01670 [Oscillospiraceae bacterium]|nr:hypothetical protein [Oscillospiraceae bacterium]